MANVTKRDIADLAQIVALLADAAAQQLDGAMSARDAAANLRNLNGQAAAIFRRLA